MQHAKNKQESRPYDNSKNGSFVAATTPAGTFALAAAVAAVTDAHHAPRILVAAYFPAVGGRALDLAPLRRRRIGTAAPTPAAHHALLGFDPDQGLVMDVGFGGGRFLRLALGGRCRRRLLLVFPFRSSRPCGIFTGSDAADAFGTVTGKVHYAIECDDLLTAVAVHQPQLPKTVPQRCSVRISFPCCQRIHERSLEEADTVFAQSLPD